MRIVRTTATLMCIITCLAVSAYAKTETKGGLRYSISVSKFENRSNWTGQWVIADTFGAVLTDSLNQTGRFIVLGESDMRAEAMAEQDLGASGRLAGGKKKPRVGQMTPAQLLVKGEITHFQHSTTGGKGGVRIKGFRIGAGKDTAEINAVIYVIDSTTAQILASKKVVGKAARTALGVGFTDKDWGANIGGFKKTNVGKAVEAAVDEAVEFIAEQIEDIPWSGAVVLVKGDKVYINRGDREGVQKGQTFVVGNVEEVRDPDTGELLDESMSTVGKIEVVTVKKKLSICSIVKGAGSIEKGMTIHLP
jgi:curli biogenesis system outer membrane secretion channel CsgG